MTFAKTPRLAAIALAAGLAITACGSDDADSPAADATEAIADDASDADDAGDTADGDAATEPASPLGATVLEVSPSVAIVGDALPDLANPNDDPAVGTMAPVITGQTFDGTEVTIGGETDGPTMLVFLAHWCPHCNDEIPEILELRDAGSFPADLNIIGISTAVTEDSDNYPPSEWVVEKNWTYPILADTDAADAFLTYGGTGFPFTVMLNADGSVNARKSGSETADQIIDWIETALLV